MGPRHGSVVGLGRAQSVRKLGIPTDTDLAIDQEIPSHSF